MTGWLADLGERANAFPGVRRFIRAVVLVGRGFRGEAITLRASATMKNEPFPSSAS